MKIVFATNNHHKLSEIKEITINDIEIVSLESIGCNEEIPETSDTIEGNALQKAMYVFDNYHIGCFADDTGLEVEALDGEPGVYSARYAGGDGHDSEANMDKLLKKLEGKTNRKARFRTVIALVLERNNPYLFEGIIEGEIIQSRKGQEGFGYDPIFKPLGYDKTFAELGNDIKNKISHRAKATRKLAQFLKKKN